MLWAKRRTTDESKPDDSRSSPQICFGVVALADRLPSVRQLLGDVGDQTTPPLEVLLVLQGVEQDEAVSLSAAVREEFTNLPISVIGNPARAVNSARNLILDACSADLVMFMDDDARLPVDALRRVAAAFRANPDAAVITFRARWIGDTMSAHAYPPSQRRRRTAWSATQVAAIEIAASVHRVRALGVRFDERFGIGGTFRTGGEFIFVVDVLRRGGRVMFVPAEISEHDAISSGLTLDDEMLYAKGAVMRRTFGVLGLPAAWLFVVQKVRKKQLRSGPFAAVRAVSRGWRAFTRDDHGPIVPASRS